MSTTGPRRDASATRLAFGQTPEQADVDELRHLLDLLESYSSNDQKARYLLTCNWMRDRLARRQSDAELMDALHKRLTGSKTSEVSA